MNRIHELERKFDRALRRWCELAPLKIECDGRTSVKIHMLPDDECRALIEMQNAYAELRHERQLVRECVMISVELARN